MYAPVSSITGSAGGVVVSMIQSAGTRSSKPLASLR